MCWQSFAVKCNRSEVTRSPSTDDRDALGSIVSPHPTFRPLVNIPIIVGGHSNQRKLNRQDVNLRVPGTYRVRDQYNHI